MHSPFYLYLITNKILNKQYIGSHISSNVNDGYMGSSKYLNEDYNTYGKENFTKEILKIGNADLNDILDEETNYILNYNTLTPNGYNKFLPNQRNGFRFAGCNHSEKSKNMLSQKLKKYKKTEQHKKNLSISCKGKSKSIETRKLMSLAKKGRSLSSATKQKISAKRSGVLRGKYNKNTLCNYCNKEISNNMYIRWHGEKCKYKIHESKIS